MRDGVGTAETSDAAHPAGPDPRSMPRLNQVAPAGESAVPDGGGEAPALPGEVLAPLGGLEARPAAEAIGVLDDVQRRLHTRLTDPRA